MRSVLNREFSDSTPSQELALWNAQMKKVVEPGSFTVMVGPNAETTPLRGQFQVGDANRR